MESALTRSKDYTFWAIMAVDSFEAIATRAWDLFKPGRVLAHSFNYQNTRPDLKLVVVEDSHLRGNRLSVSFRNDIMVFGAGSISDETEASLNRRFHAGYRAGITEYRFEGRPDLAECSMSVAVHGDAGYATKYTQFAYNRLVPLIQT